MNEISFKSFTGKLVERKTSLPTTQFNKLSPKMKAAITDMYAMINKASDPLISKIEGIVKAVSKKHGVSVYDIEDYIDNELIK